MEEIYYYENNQKKGPVNFDDFPNLNINRDTLIWYKGLDNWKKIKDIKDLIPGEIFENIPPPIDDDFSLKSDQIKRSASKVIIKLYRNLIKLFLIAILFSLVISLFRVYNDEEINLLSSKLENHLKDFNHPKETYCDFGVIPKFLEESPILYRESEQSYYGKNSDEMIDEIISLDTLHYRNYLINKPDFARNYYFFTVDDANEINNSIQCVYHNRAIDYKANLIRAKIEESILIGIGLTCLLFILYFLYKTILGIKKYAK